MASIFRGVKTTAHRQGLVSPAQAPTPTHLLVSFDSGHRAPPPPQSDRLCTGLHVCHSLSLEPSSPRNPHGDCLTCWELLLLRAIPNQPAKSMPTTQSLSSLQSSLGHLLTCSVCCAQESPTLCDPMGCSLPSSSVHGIFQARILELVAISHSRGSSRLRDQTHVSCVPCMGRQILYCQATWEVRQVL